MRATERYALLDHVPVGECVLRQDGTVLFWNSRLEEWTNISRHQIVGQKITSFFPNLREAKYDRRLRQTFEHGLTVIFCSQLHPHLIPCPRIDGQLRVQHTTVTPLPNTNQDEYDALLSIQDVSELTQQIQDYKIIQEKAWEEIKKRQDAEEQLQRERDLLNGIVSTSVAAITVVDLNGKIVFANDQAEQLLGISRSTLTTLGYNSPHWHFTDFDGNPFPSDQLPFAQVMRTGKAIFAVCHAITRQDGTRRYLLINGAPLRDQEGAISRVVFSISDITDHYLAEQARQETTATLETIIQSSPLAIVTLNEQGTVTLWNHAAEELLGWTADEALGKPLPNIPEKLKPRFYRFLQNVFQEQSFYGLETSCRRKDDSLIEVSLSRAPLYNATGKILGSMYVLTDITERKRASEALKSLNDALEQKVQERTQQLQRSLNFEATLKRITDKVRDSLDEQQILQTAVEELGRVLDAKCCNTGIYSLNAKTTAIQHEYTNSQLCTTGCPIHIISTDSLHQQLQQGHYLQYCSINVDSIDQRFVALVCPILDDQEVLGDMWICRNSDQAFSEQEIWLVCQVANQCAIALRQSRLYQSVQTQVHELERLNHLKDDFLSTVSHELRTPLSSIKMSIEMLEVMLKQPNQGTEPHPPFPQPSGRINQCLKILRDECDREINLVTDILALQNLEAGTQPIQPSSINLQDWVSQISEVFLEQAQTQQQHFRICIPDDLPPLISDIFMFTRVIKELLTNAFKFTPSGESIIVNAEVVASTIQLTVTNSGIAIPEQELHQVFNQFYRIPSNDPWKHGGTGMGLALVKKLVTYLEGRIWATSSNNETQFIVELPLEPSFSSLGTSTLG